MNSEVIKLDLDLHTYQALQRLAKASGQTLDVVINVILAMEVLKRESITNKL